MKDFSSVLGPQAWQLGIAEDLITLGVSMGIHSSFLFAQWDTSKTCYKHFLRDGAPVVRSIIPLINLPFFPLLPNITTLTSSFMLPKIISYSFLYPSTFRVCFQGNPNCNTLS